MLSRTRIEVRRTGTMIAQSRHAGPPDLRRRSARSQDRRKARVEKGKRQESEAATVVEGALQQAAAVQTALGALTSGATTEVVAHSFGRATAQRIELVEEFSKPSR